MIQVKNNVLLKKRETNAGSSLKLLQLGLLSFLIQMFKNAAVCLMGNLGGAFDRGGG